jgi:hypothetical protein
VSKVSDPTGLPYAGGGPTVKDDGTPMTNTTARVVQDGTDTTSLTSVYDGAAQNAGADPAGTISAPDGTNRSAGQNSGTGFAAD